MSRTPAGTVPALLALLAAPWSVQVFAGGDATFVFAWGLLDGDPLRVTTLYHFLFVYTAGLPAYIRSWPLSVGLYALAVGLAAVGPRVGYDDGRVVAGLLVAAGVAQFSLAEGLSVQPGRTAWPVGTVLLFGAAAYVYAFGGDDAGARNEQ